MFIATKPTQSTSRFINAYGRRRVSPRIFADLNSSRFMHGFHLMDAASPARQDIAADELRTPVLQSQPIPDVVMVWNEDDEDDAEDLIYSDLDEEEEDPGDLEDLDEDFDFGDEDDDAPLTDDDDKPDDIQIDDDDDE